MHLARVLAPYFWHLTFLVNRLRYSLDLKRINKKRVFRIMRINNLVLPKAPVQRNHTGTGKVMTLKSNTRWCSDCFEIKCFNGEKVFVSFVIDSCDREIISFRALKSPLQAIDIELLMINAVVKNSASTCAGCASVRMNGF